MVLDFKELLRIFELFELTPKIKPRVEQNVEGAIGKAIKGFLTPDKKIMRRNMRKGEETDGSGRSANFISRETGDSIPMTVKDSWINKDGKFIYYRNGVRHEALLGDTLSWNKVKDSGYVFK